MDEVPAWISGASEPIPPWITGEQPEPVDSLPPIPHKTPTINIEIIDELKPFLSPSRYKVAYGGRGSSKSWGIARMLIARAYARRERILCCREFQGSIGESVLALLESQIQMMGLTKAFEIQAKKITCLTSGSVFLFEGLKSNVTKIKSMEGITLVWAEEAEKIQKNSWDVLIPTIRQPGSEIWISFNPDDDLDETYVRFVEDPPPDCYSVLVNYHLNPWFPEVLRKEMEYLKNKDYSEYEHVWEGKPRAALLGAYYTEQMLAAHEDKRIGNIPHDETIPVQVSFDLGMADSMVLWFAQRVGTAVMVIDCWEYKGTTLSSIIKDIERSDYRISQVILPHDGKVQGMISGLRRHEVFSNAGYNVTIAPGIHEGVGVDDGIRATKAFLKRCYFDKIRCADGIKALKRYRTKYNEERKVFNNTPLHDWCLAGDTKIAVTDGLKRIDEIVVGDEIKLGNQRYPVIATHDNGYKPTIEIAFSNGSKITCTPDHKIFTTRGLVRASNLLYSDEILTDKEDISTWLQTEKGIKEAFTGNTQELSLDSGNGAGYTVPRRGAGRYSCTGFYGPLSGARYPQGLLLSPLRMIGRTLISVIGSAGRGDTMASLSNPYTPASSLMGLNTIKTLEQDTIITHSQEVTKPFCIEIFTNISTALKPLKGWMCTISTLIKRIMPWRTSKHCHVVSICESTGTMKRVHDLTVAHQHAYYADGILVSNCSDFADSFRYLAITEPEVEFNTWGTDIEYTNNSKHI